MTEAEIRDLVGELMVAGFDGTAVGDHARRLVAHHRVKNIILFKRNVASVAQLTELNASLQALARDAGHTLPLIICTDQENGIVRRVAPGVPGLPGNMAIGATGDVDNAYTVGRLTALQLRAMGVNMDLAPVLDVNNNPDNPVIGVRSYGEDPDRVAAFGAAMVRGLQEHGVAACGKHFPGHGDTSVDSHLALPEIPHDRARLQAVELKPFLRAMEAGVDVLMTAHVVFPSMEPRRIPATLSKAVLTDFLRGELGYQGVVTTDCLEMNAISETVGVAEGAVLALLAGADLLMVSHRLDRQEAAIEAVVRAVLEGRIPEARLVEAAGRVRKLRAERAAANPAAVVFDDWMERTAVCQQQLCAAAATVVANRAGLLPLDPARVEAVDLLVDDSIPRSSASDNTASTQFLIDAVTAALPGADVRVHTVGDRLDAALLVGRSHDALTVAGISGLRNAAYLQLVRDLARQGRPVVAFGLQNPYDLRAVADVPTQVAVYEYTPWMVRAGVEALFGRGGTGRLPVTL
ncbi:MAG: beta-N-acetylhexosaminidase [Alicyclobacillus sp.]|nr:beta-N-acetylhexosaminidase [Alicyclobacillus sp.]